MLWLWTPQLLCCWRWTCGIWNHFSCTAWLLLALRGLTWVCHHPVAPPVKMEEVALFLIDVDLVEHALYIAGECQRFLSEVTLECEEQPSQSNKTINCSGLSLNFCGTFVSTCCWAGRFGSEILDRSCFSVETMVFFVGFKVTVLFNSDFYFLITLAGESSPCNSPCSFMHSSCLSWSFNLLRSLSISWCLFKVSHLL